MAKKNPVPNELFWKARQGLNLSRSQLADAANREPVMRTCGHAPFNENLIGRIEQGRIGGGMCQERLAALCATLDVQKPAEIGLVAGRRLPTRSGPARPRSPASNAGRSDVARVSSDEHRAAATAVAPTSESHSGMNRRGVVAGWVSPVIGVLVAAVAGPFRAHESGLSREPVQLGALAADLSTVRRAYQHSRYGTAAAALPDLLAALRRARGDAEHRHVAALESEAYQVASGLLLKGGEPVLAAIASERCTTAAEKSEDHLAVACGARALAHCLVADGHAHEGAALAVRAADALSTCTSMNTPEALSVYGALLLRGAIAAARYEDRDHAYALLDEATRTAAHLGADRNLRWTAFGPANVAAHRVAVAVDLGDAGYAVAQAEKIDMHRLRLPERKAMVLLDTARALTQWGKWERAFGAIRAAEQQAPEEVRTRPVVHHMINKLAQWSPSPLQRQVIEYATHVGANK